jgi:Domain of unknown function (DUF4372)
MFTGKMMFAQIADFRPLHPFRRRVGRYPSAYPGKTFSQLDQFLCMAFPQLTFRESLRDIEVRLRAHQTTLYHRIRGDVARNTLPDYVDPRDWRIYRDFANRLIKTARELDVIGDLGVDLANTVDALETTTIDLSLSVFPGAHFRATKAVVKMHTQIDPRGNIPSFIHVSDRKMHEVNGLDILPPEPGSFTIMGRGFLDFARLYRFTLACAIASHSPQTQYRVPTRLFPRGRQNDRPAL